MTLLKAFSCVLVVCVIAALLNAYQRWRAGEFTDPFDVGDL